MAKNKLQKFDEMAQFPNVFQHSGKESFEEDFHLKGKWNEKFFNNTNPIILELGCGKGEYTIDLAKKYFNKNFIGIDIKGARIWRGAKTSNEINLRNVAFLRTKIENISNFFQNQEVSEIWIPFPDPQPKKPKKRLSSFIFLNLYQKILTQNGIIHLKTDSFELYQYTLDTLKSNQIEPLEAYLDLYSSGCKSVVKQTQTFYEKMFLEQGKKITYLSFRLNINKNLIQPEKIEIDGYKY